MYPRALREKETSVLESVLPPDRPGYRRIRDLISSMVVLGEGRRGEGNIVLGFEGDAPIFNSPPAPVIAYGAIETTQDIFSITVRDCENDQIDVEILSAHGLPLPDHFEEKRRWSLSIWQPGMESPRSTGSVREIVIDDHVVFVLAQRDRRLWVHERESGMNLPVPVTTYYNALMLLKGIRDPAVSLHARLLFDGPGTYSDNDLRQAFLNYNAVRPKVAVRVPVLQRKESIWRSLLQRWSPKKA